MQHGCCSQDSLYGGAVSDHCLCNMFVTPDTDTLKFVKLVLDPDKLDNTGMLRTSNSILADFKAKSDSRIPDGGVRDWIERKILPRAGNVLRYNSS